MSTAPTTPPSTPPRIAAMLHPVHLVGAGPGDPELLTLKAVRVLRQATVILVDDLVGEQVLPSALAGLNPAPRVIWVGKRGGRSPAAGPFDAAQGAQREAPLRTPGTGHSTPQAFIEKLMLREALAGEKVVRLKGGDPLIFGRAGEEIAALRQAGLQVEVVNGITSGLAAVNALGTGWTDRRHAQGVMLITGHPQPGGQEPDWPAISAAAASGITLVIYMGVVQAPRIVAHLLAHLPAELPAAVVQHASHATRQRSAIATLGTLVQTLQSQGFGSPAVLVIGRVLEAAGVEGLAELSRVARA